MTPVGWSPSLGRNPPQIIDTERYGSEQPVEALSVGPGVLLNPVVRHGIQTAQLVRSHGCHCHL